MAFVPAICHFPRAQGGNAPSPTVTGDFAADVGGIGGQHSDSGRDSRARAVCQPSGYALAAAVWAQAHALLSAHCCVFAMVRSAPLPSLLSTT